MKTEKTFTLNGEQKAAAFCEENAVIAAGAGSGKTMVLASRYVWLITKRKFRVREILTLTFTKKAVAQMYSRIHIELAKRPKKILAKKVNLHRKHLMNLHRRGYRHWIPTVHQLSDRLQTVTE